MLHKNDLFSARFLSRLCLSFIFVLGLTFVACSSGDEEQTPMEHEEEHEEDEHGHEEEGGHEHGEEEEMVPNNGAVVEITSPADGATFAEGEDVLVEINVENFELGVDGAHWHEYVDGSSWGMVMGSNTDQVLVGLEPGERMIKVHLANGDHQNLEDGDTVHIMIEE